MSAAEHPAWVTREFLQNALRHGLKDNTLKVMNVSIKGAVGAGDNYASQMLRVSLDYTKNEEKALNTLFVVLKCLPKVNLMQDYVRESQFFERETMMFTKTLPEIHELLENAAPGRYSKLYADVYYTQGPPNDVLMLEDLSSSGFRSASRFKGVDLDHSILFLESLARLHASSYALVNNQPSVIDDYQECLYHPSKEKTLTKLFKDGVAVLAEETKTWSDIPPEYTQKLKAMENVILNKCFESYKRDDSKMNVILHGDAWVGNSMFKYENSKVIDMKFVDFQLPNYNSPALDVNYFIFTSVQQKVREKHFDLLLQKYHGTFVETLRVLGQTVSYSFDDFKKDFFDRLMFGFVTSLLIFPFMCLPPEEAADIGNLLDDNASDYKNKQLFRTEYYVYVTKRNLPFFEKHGVF